jgi:hypothetical protein
LRANSEGKEVKGKGEVREKKVNNEWVKSAMFCARIEK